MPDLDDELKGLRARLIEIASQMAAVGENRALEDVLRHLMTTVTSDGGLPAFMPYEDSDRRVIWAESRSLSPRQWERVVAYALQKLENELS